MKELDELLGIWPSHAEFARDTGIDPKHLSVMVQRQSIPTRFWSSIIKAAERRAKDARSDGDQKAVDKFEQVTADSLLKLSDALDKSRAK